MKKIDFSGDVKVKLTEDGKNILSNEVKGFFN